MLNYYKICNLPIDSILHDDKPAYVKEGHGGKQVGNWPIYSFFKLYHSGEKETAELCFVNWYIDQYEKYSETDKSKGGMKDGSLDKLVKDTPDISYNKELFENAVLTRVQLRFQLFESISRLGYSPDHVYPVSAIQLNGNHYKLISGHHRTAILAALGYEFVPDVFVFSGKIMNLCYRIRERIKRMTQVKSTFIEKDEIDLYF